MGRDDGQHNGPQPVILEVDESPRSETEPKAIPSHPSIKSTDRELENTESIRESGRTYHKYNQGNYFLPNDDEEQDRLDLQHHLFSLTFDGHSSLAPIANPTKVLDIGTGTGIWAVEYALQNPSATVTGSDLSPIKRKSIPPNCNFINYPIHFDYIHGRALFSCFREPLSVFQSALTSLEPGGYFEMQEIYFRPHSNDSTISGTALEAWNAKVVEGAKILGKDWWCTPRYKGWFEEAGFVDVQEKIFYWPGNEWAKGEKQKELGRMMFANSLKGVSAISLMVLTKVFGMSVEEVEANLVEVKKDMENLNIHTYYPM
ncbi:S-adenosyl-L-methionine-dependent methyltransferase [Stipitochalara longipes BDJ]|nr:S-adenosyl-L-methionine-dependent methyltransferase [Stipitochalara longipes BDJ]